MNVYSHEPPVFLGRGYTFGAYCGRLVIHNMFLNNLQQMLSH